MDPLPITLLIIALALAFIAVVKAPDWVDDWLDDDELDEDEE